MVEFQHRYQARYHAICELCWRDRVHMRLLARYSSNLNAGRDIQRVCPLRDDITTPDPWIRTLERGQSTLNYRRGRISLASSLDKSERAAYLMIRHISNNYLSDHQLFRTFNNHRFKTVWHYRNWSRTLAFMPFYDHSQIKWEIHQQSCRPADPSARRLASRGNGMRLRASKSFYTPVFIKVYSSQHLVQSI